MPLSQSFQISEELIARAATKRESRQVTSASQLPSWLLDYGEQIRDGGDLPSLEPREISMTQGDERLKSELVPVSTQERADLLYYLLRSLETRRPKWPATPNWTLVPEFNSLGASLVAI